MPVEIEVHSRPAEGRPRPKSSESWGLYIVARILTQSGTKRQNPLVDMRKQEILQSVAQNDKIQNP